MSDRNASLDQLVQDAIAPIVERVSSAIAKRVAGLVAQALARELTPRAARRGGRAAPARSKPRPGEMTRWVADKRARRVPKFVIEATGLDTKRKIVAKYGENAAFEKGKPLPAEAKPAEPKAVKAKPPTIRKKSAAA